MNYKKLIDDVIAQSQIFDLPAELQPQTFHIWKGDIDPEKDWDDFIGGQLVNHVYYQESFKGGVDILNLTYGNTASSFYSLLSKNTTIEIYTNEYIELDGAFITIGEDHDKKYLATSYRLDNFKLKDQDKEVFLGKIILIDLVKKMSEELDDTTIAPTINIANGKLGESIDVPRLKKRANNKDIEDIDVKDYEIKQETNARAKSIEFYFDKPAVIAAPDVIANSEGSPEYDKRITPINASMKPKTFPVNPWYAILPTQFAIPSVDNYGFSHYADASNTAKVIAATQSLGQVAQTGLNLSMFSHGLKGIGSAGIGLAQKLFGDKGTLANSGAIVPQAVKGSGDGLKFFIQGDSAGGLITNPLDENGYLNLQMLRGQNDYIEINQANGEFGKYGKPMSPASNDQFNSPFHFRALGASQIDHNGRPDKIPWLATPFVATGFDKLKIDDNKIADYLKWGTPRLNIYAPDNLAPMIAPENWSFHVRCMYFRPDPYTYQQWSMIMPAEIGVYNVKNETSISYDTTIPKATDAVDMITNLINGGQESSNTTKQGRNSYWNKTITIDQLELNNLYDPNKTFTSGRLEFDTNAFTQSVGGKFRSDLAQSLYQFQFFGFTDSIVQIKILDKNDKVIRHHKFNSQGKNVGTAAAALNVFQF